MYDSLSLPAGLGELEAGDPGVGRRRDNFSRTSKLVHNTHSHKREAQGIAQDRSNSLELGGS